jgi:hypothetical protein
LVRKGEEACWRRGSIPQSKKKRNLPVSRWVIGPMIKKSEARAIMIHDMISFIALVPFQSHLPIDRSG